jgi:hypothetical protein
VTSNPASPSLRQYLLGQGSEDERATTEERYFADEQVLDDLELAEEDLIEDYLAGDLSAEDRESFERVYLSTPGHRRRVDLVRRLTAISSASTQGAAETTAPRAAATVLTFPRRRWAVYAGLAAAASVLITAGVVWMRSAQVDDGGRVAQAPAISAPESPGVAPAPPTPAPVLFAVALSPIQVRGAAESAAVVIPPGTDLLELRLEGESVARPPDGWRVSVRTVAGESIWEGADVGGDAPSGVVARVRIPASRLPVDDYVLSLSAADAAGVNTERERYFLRVRAR